MEMGPVTRHTRRRNTKNVMKIWFYLQKLHLNGTRFSSTISSENTTAIDYNYQSNKICWITQTNMSKGAKLLCANLNDFSNSHEMSLPYDLERKYVKLSCCYSTLKNSFKQDFVEICWLRNGL